ncbi:hypothetical protein PG996_012024 [Apiospora saccharicola]|uniref:Uncharacterized protein n=1 Tax=Apiospora saccharicola TaxID=335842 RepID=A0ABR1U1E1_9PEZI
MLLAGAAAPAVAAPNEVRLGLRGLLLEHNELANHRSTKPTYLPLRNTDRKPSWPLAFDISAPVYDPGNTNGAPSIPSFAATCEGHITEESPSESAYVDCTANRKKGDISEGGTFESLQARVLANADPDSNANPQTNSRSGKGRNIFVNHTALWVTGDDYPHKFNIVDKKDSKDSEMAWSQRLN